MHATIPALPHGIHFLMHSGYSRTHAPRWLEQISGCILARTIAAAVRLGFGYLVLEGMSDAQSRKAEAFFEKNFVMRDPASPNGVHYYQGKFLLRTRQPKDNMNVYICFCPDPGNLYLDTPFGKCLNPLAIVRAEVVSKKRADAIEQDPKLIDLVIRFRDIPSILGLVQRPDADAVQLLLDNLVQITGNFGHLFKFGAIGKSVQSEITGLA